MPIHLPATVTRRRMCRVEVLVDAHPVRLIAIAARIDTRAPRAHGLRR
ncbi:MAG: hypothetical protein M3Y48_10615 [Actinomycetota bacterium]|nr:hypothetical protein [Actinomycetota bacterium]